MPFKSLRLTSLVKKTRAAPKAVTPQVKSVPINACMMGENCSKKATIIYLLFSI